MQINSSLVQLYYSFHNTTKLFDHMKPADLCRIENLWNWSLQTHSKQKEDT
jgi:hypothetical protein